MTIIYILFIIILIGGIVTAFAIVTIDNFREYIIRINEAEANIETTLNKRFDILNKSTDIIKSVIDTDDDILKTITNIRSQKLDNYELDKELYHGIEEFHEYAETNIELKENDDYTKAEINIIESEAEIIALKEYYNDIVIKYNELVSNFPTSLVAKIKKYDTKEIFEMEDHLELINSLK